MSVPWLRGGGWHGPVGCAKMAKVGKINRLRASASPCTTTEHLEARISFKMKGSPCLTMKASLSFVIKRRHEVTYCHALHSHHDSRLSWQRCSTLTITLPTFEHQFAQFSLSCSLLSWRLYKSTMLSHLPQWSHFPWRSSE